MKTIRVVAAVIRDGRRIFATQRGYGPWKDWWEFPGGKIEEGETPEAALVRELREELDTEITVGEKLALGEGERSKLEFLGRLLTAIYDAGIYGVGFDAFKLYTVIVILQYLCHHFTGR